MSNSLLPKVHFDLLVDASVHGPADVATGDWPLEFDASCDVVGAELVVENLHSQTWHELWRIIYAALGGDCGQTPDAELMSRASQYAAAAVADRCALDKLFAPEE